MAGVSDINEAPLREGVIIFMSSPESVERVRVARGRSGGCVRTPLPFSCIHGGRSLLSPVDMDECVLGYTVRLVFRRVGEDQETRQL